MKKYIFINRRAIDDNFLKKIKNHPGDFEPCIAVSDKINEVEENVVHAYDATICDSTGRPIVRVVCNPDSPLILNKKTGPKTREDHKIMCWIEVDADVEIKLKLRIGETDE